MSRFRMLLGKRTPPAVGYDLSPKPLRGAYRQGINMSGPESGNSYPSSEMLVYWASHGLSWVRQPLSWTALQPTASGALDPGELAKVSALLARAAALKMVVLLDLHAYGRHGVDLLGSSALPVAAFADFWKRFSAFCMADPNFAVIKGYDLNNEWNAMDPNAGYDSTTYSRNLIATATQQAISAIRQNGDTSWIYVEGDRWTGAWEWLPNNAAWFLALNDPAGKLIASAHCYLDNDSSGTNFAWQAETQKPGISPPGLPTNVQVGPQRLSKLVAWAYQNNVRLHLGECGWGYDDDGWRQAGDNLVAYLKACNIEFTYWSAGYNFPPRAGYQYNPDPYRGASRDFTPFGTPTPQGAVLQKYAGPPTAYTIAWPQDGAGNPLKYGTKNQASAAFKILFGGNIAAPITITPAALNADGTAAGGTFTPASVVLTAGSHVNDVASFTYTPAVDGTFQILATNDSGLVDPAPIGFSTLADPFRAAAVAVDPLNVIWPTRIFSPYIGPAITVRRASDGAPKTVGFTNAGFEDTATLDAWANGSAMSVVTLSDQGVNGQPLGTVTSGDNKAGPLDGNGNPTYLASNPGDYPAFVENAYNGLPALRFSASRMDAYNGIDGLTGLTVFFALNPQSAGDAQWIMNWQVDEQNLIGDGGGGWSVAYDNPLSETLGIQPGMHVYAVRFDGVNKLRDVFRDGGKIASQATVLSRIVSKYGPQVNVGWFRYYPSGKPNFDLAGMIVIPAALTDAQVAVFMARMSTDLGIVQVGAPGAMTLNGTAGQNDIPVKVASAPANGNAISWQYRTPGNAWQAAGTTTLSSGASALTFDFTGLVANTTYDLQAVGTNGSYVGPAAQLLGQKTAAAPPGTGTKLKYVGINYTGLEGGANNNAGDIDQQIAYHSGIAMNVARVPFRWDRVAPTLGGGFSSADIAKLDAMVSKVTGAGMYALIDVHNYGGGPGGKIGASGGPTNAQYAQFMGMLGDRYKSNNKVMIDLMNEPSQTDQGAWLTTMNAGVQAIRQAGFAGRLVVPFCYDNNRSSYYGADPSAVSDPNNNFAWSIHQYFNGSRYASGAYDGSTGQTDSVSIGIDMLVSVTNWARFYGQKLFLGEFGGGRDATSAGNITNLLAYMQSNGDVWDGTTIWWAGAVGTADELHPAPTQSDGNLGYANVVSDAPQVAAMRRFIAGGDLYGQDRPTVVIDNANNPGDMGFDNTPIYAGDAGSSKSGGSSYVSHNNGSHTNDGVMAKTVEASVSLVSSGGVQFICGCNSHADMWVDGDGYLLGFVGNGSGALSLKSLAPILGSAHRIALSVGPAGCFLFVDGALQASSTTPFANTTPQDGGWWSRGGYNKPAGRVSNVLITSKQRYTAAYTPSTQPPTGKEAGALYFWPLYQDGRCLL